MISGDKEAELTEHLAELRTRIIWSSVSVILCAVVCWFLYDRIFALLTAPVAHQLKRTGTKFLFTSIAQPFMIRLQIALLSGLIAASPFVTLQIFLFVAPGLTAEEKRPLRWMIPLSALLFAAGVFMCYKILPTGISWFLSYVPPDVAELRPDVSQTLMFILKMMLAFGISFQLPIVMVLLGKLGVVDAKMMASYWRYALVGIAVVAAVATPSGDALTMLMLAAPLAALYAFSILLVKLTQPKDGS